MLAGQHFVDPLGRVQRHAGHALSSLRGIVGRQEHVAHSQERVVLLRRLLFVNINGRASDRPVTQSLDQVRFDNYVAPRSVDEEGRFLHEGELLLADNSLVGGAARDV